MGIGFTERAVHWRYHELMPIARRFPLPALQVGWRPRYATSGHSRIASNIAVTARAELTRPVLNTQARDPAKLTLVIGNKN